MIMGLDRTYHAHQFRPIVSFFSFYCTLKTQYRIISFQEVSDGSSAIPCQIVIIAIISIFVAQLHLAFLLESVI